MTMAFTRTALTFPKRRRTSYRRTGSGSAGSTAEGRRTHSSNAISVRASARTMGAAAAALFASRSLAEPSQLGPR